MAKLTESQFFRKYTDLLKEDKPEFDSAEELSSQEDKENPDEKPEFDSSDELSSHEDYSPLKKK
jgi:hypothetical protein